MNLAQGMAVWILWQTGRLDTADISSLLDIHEADVCRILDAIRAWQRGPSLTVIEGSVA